VGVELDDPVGLNSGVVEGVTYFKCAENRGIFVVPRKVTVLRGANAPHEAGVVDAAGTLRRRTSTQDTTAAWETESVRYSFPTTVFVKQRRACEQCVQPYAVPCILQITACDSDLLRVLRSSFLLLSRQFFL
jgi:hypothetical protein